MQSEASNSTSSDLGRSAAPVAIGLALGLLMLAAAALGYWHGWEQVKGDIRESLGPALKRLHRPLDRFFDNLPMWVAQACAIGLFVLAAVFAWCMPRRFVYLGAPDQARWRDLRIWATAVLVPYMIIYYLLGL